MKKNKTLKIWCDGSSKNNECAWGAVIDLGGGIRMEHSGKLDIKGTSTTAEIYAIAKSLEKVKKRFHIIVYTDCQSIVKKYKQYKNVLPKNYKDKKELKQAWIKLNDVLLLFKMGVKIKWIKGHAKNLENNRAHKLAKIARERIPDKKVNTQNKEKTKIIQLI